MLKKEAARELHGSLTGSQQDESSNKNGSIMAI